MKLTDKAIRQAEQLVHDNGLIPAVEALALAVRRGDSRYEGTETLSRFYALAHARLDSLLAELLSVVQP